ncbi:GNAT family N-acetyltransferase [Streptomyces sp. ACA25]|uniref:GNAT family N-acetyltransferase n=1 Tax=Streptomyces sp. ACA25 TaxID=3022596 RepID=UPI002307311D|nr:GNAT family N-acetyltransferase [Streptomyces sp. ACA25]MDB1088955.1 GNAT family N-acetyltransferase [Streptomyces sp. ACA25]
MTTTLRPTGPERRSAEGLRSRSYDICDNGRAVGALRLAADPRSPVRAGRIEELAVDPAERRRGRATVAALTAEEVLRGWGCKWAEISVSPGQDGAGQLTAALGYAESGRSLRKPLAGGPPGLPPDSSARSLTRAEYPAWLAAWRAAFIRCWTERGGREALAAALADETHRRLLPAGPASDGTALRVLVHDGTDVGTLWAARGSELADAAVEGHVRAAEVAEGRRGEGHGRTLMLEAERVCHAAGVRTLGVRVRTGNTPALRLTASLGYLPLAVHLTKPLS